MCSVTLGNRAVVEGCEECFPHVNECKMDRTFLKKWVKFREEGEENEYELSNLENCGFSGSWSFPLNCGRQRKSVYVLD